jgi:hypothetical protein
MNTTATGTVTLANGETRSAAITRTSADLAALLGTEPQDQVGYWTGGKLGSGRWVLADDKVSATFKEDDAAEAAYVHLLTTHPHAF